MGQGGFALHRARHRASVTLDRYSWARVSVRRHADTMLNHLTCQYFRFFEQQTNLNFNAARLIQHIGGVIGNKRRWCARDVSIISRRCVPERTPHPDVHQLLFAFITTQPLIITVDGCVFRRRKTPEGRLFTGLLYLLATPNLHFRWLPSVPDIQHVRILCPAVTTTADAYCRFYGHPSAVAIRHDRLRLRSDRHKSSDAGRISTFPVTSISDDL